MKILKNLGKSTILIPVLGIIPVLNKVTVCIENSWHFLSNAFEIKLISRIHETRKLCLEFKVRDFSFCEKKIKTLNWKSLKTFPLHFVKNVFNPLSSNPTKWTSTLKQFVGKLPTNCLSVFDHFVKLELKGLRHKEIILHYLA